MKLYPEDIAAGELRESFRHATGGSPIGATRKSQNSKRKRTPNGRKRRALERKPKPEKDRRTIRFQLCFNAAEYARVRAYVGERETGKALRELILSALPSEPETAE